MEKENRPQEKTEGSIGARFQKETKYTPENIGGHTLDWDHMPKAFKEYENPLARIALPKPEIGGETDIWRILAKRRSRRAFDHKKTLTAGTLSALLWATQGITSPYGQGGFRTAPSAGGLYPIETYLHIRAVEGIDAGLYHLRPREFDLEFLRKGDFSITLARAGLDQSVLAEAHTVFIWSAYIERSKWKYRERAYRYIYLDAGHIAQNLYLAAEALHLGTCAVGAFFDGEVNDLIGLDGKEETVIYMAAVGRPV
ncbi:MAG TPA: SagB/ThcOx family dehydrogenase [Syntrophorhabdaceae bacterium]|jgi:SagB-type dehydrogenase family enzyme